MSTELVTRMVMVPHTGEAIDLADATLGGLAALLDDLTDHKARLRHFEGAVFEVLIAEMDRQRKWTLDVGDFKLVGKSDAPEVDYDTDALAFALTGLVESGTISSEAMDAACEAVTTWKVRKAGVNALRKNPALAEVIDGCAVERPVEGRRVRVARK